MTTLRFDAAIAVTPLHLAGTSWLDQPQEAVEVVRRAVERLNGAAWIDVEWRPVALLGPMTSSVSIVSGADQAELDALAATVEMVARRALEVKGKVMAA